jgi:hypothetical protein
MQTKTEHQFTEEQEPSSHTIYTVVDGGLVQEVRGIPPGIEVHILDYDIEGADEVQISPLDGEACVITEYSFQPTPT